VQAGLDAPAEGSRGTTFAHTVVQMRPGRGPAEYNLSIRLHEVMHRMGLNVDHTDLRASVMSYPYLGRNKTKVVMPEADDLVQLVDVDNPPSSTSAD